MFFHPDLDAIERWSGDSSRTTHGATECVDASRLFGRIIGRALLGRPEDEVALGDAGSFPPGNSQRPPWRLCAGPQPRSARNPIRRCSGTGGRINSRMASNTVRNWPS